MTRFSLLLVVSLLSATSYAEEAIETKSTMIYYNLVETPQEANQKLYQQVNWGSLSLSVDMDSCRYMGYVTWSFF